MVAQLMGVVDGVPQHVGELYAMDGKSAGGASFSSGDWSKSGYLFSTRVPGIPTQPPFEDAP